MINAGWVRKLPIVSTSRTMTNHLLTKVSQIRFDYFSLTFILCVVGLDEKEKVVSKIVKVMRSRSPTLRKTETQDVYRTFVDLPESYAPGGVMYMNEQILVHDETNDNTRQIQHSNKGNVDTQGINSPKEVQGYFAQTSPALGERKNVRIMNDPNDATSFKTGKSKRKMTAAEKKAADEMKKRKSIFLNKTRWLPDSAFTTYFGKPAFHAYGKGNVNPTVGGVNYG